MRMRARVRLKTQNPRKSSSPRRVFRPGPQRRSEAHQQDRDRQQHQAHQSKNQASEARGEGSVHLFCEEGEDSAGERAADGVGGEGGGGGEEVAGGGEEEEKGEFEIRGGKGKREEKDKTYASTMKAMSGRKMRTREAPRRRPLIMGMAQWMLWKKGR